MIDVLTDLHLAGGLAYSTKTDSTKFDLDIVYKSIYKKYNTDSAAVKKSVLYYSRKPERFDLIYKQVDSNLNAIQSAEVKRDNQAQLAEGRRQQQREAIAKSKAKVAADRIKMSKGLYDFGLPEYKMPGALYFTNWNITGRAPYKTLKTDSITKASLLKKPNKK
jgi:hypothetical protein